MNFAASCMASELEIRPLGPRELCDAFDAGPSAGGVALTTFLRSYAKQHLRLGVSATHLSIVDGRTAGYVTLASISVSSDELAVLSKKRLPPGFTGIALLIGRTATAVEFQGKGLVGPRLMRDVVFAEAAARRAGSGCLGIVTDAKPESVRFYARYGFVTLQEPDDPTRTTRMLLPYAVVQQAMETSADQTVRTSPP